MKNNFRGESLVAIVVGIAILSIVLLGIGNLMMYSRALIEKYQDQNNIDILKNNIKNIIRNIDTKQVQENEIFYINKDIINKRFDIFTGSTNSNYKYINRLGENIIDPVNYEGSVYSRILWKEKSLNKNGIESEVIKISVKKLIKN